MYSSRVLPAGQVLSVEVCIALSVHVCVRLPVSMYTFSPCACVRADVRILATVVCPPGRLYVAYRVSQADCDSSSSLLLGPSRRLKERDLI